MIWVVIEAPTVEEQKGMLPRHDVKGTLLFGQGSLEGVAASCFVRSGKRGFFNFEEPSCSMGSPAKQSLRKVPLIPSMCEANYPRGLKDHVNTRILDSGSTAQDKGDSIILPIYHIRILLTLCFTEESIPTLSFCIMSSACISSSYMTHGQNSIQGGCIGVIWSPCSRATRLGLRSFDHSSHAPAHHIKKRLHAALGNRDISDRSYELQHNIRRLNTGL